MMTLRNATIVHLHPASVAHGVDVVIDGDSIAAVGPDAGRARVASPGSPAGESGTASAERSSSRTIDLGGRILMPGLVCGHTHLYSALSRGILARVPPSTDFVSILANLWWRLDRAIDEEALRMSGLVGCVEAVKAGCTAVVDHHASPSCIGGSLDVLKGCFEQIGLRGVLCYETTDRNGAAGMKAGIEENRRFARLAKKERMGRGGHRLVEAMVGGHAPFTLGEEALAALGEVVRETGRGFHVHVAEDSFDQSYSHRYHGMDPLARLDRHGLLTERSIIAHGVHLTEADRELLAARGSFLAHQARSNMGNRVGYAMALAGTRNVILGTDGIGADMLEETKFAYFKHQDAGGTLAPTDFGRFLQNGNELLSRAFDRRFGRIEPGFAADLVVLDYSPPTPLVAENVGGHLVFGLSSAHVDSVIVGGRFVMEDRKFAWDTAAVFRQAEAAARRLWQRMEGV